MLIHTSKYINILGVRCIHNAVVQAYVQYYMYPEAE